jgi:hypothetical protein
MTDITNLVLSHTQPVREEIDKLKYENRKLREDLDSVEQYGRRSLISISAGLLVRNSLRWGVEFGEDIKGL